MTDHPGAAIPAEDSRRPARLHGGLRSISRLRIGLLLAAGAGLLGLPASAQVTPAMKAQIAAIGAVVDPPSTVALYRPLQPSAPYPGVKIVRDQAYGPAPREVLDVFTPDGGSKPMPVLLFVAGGMGNKIEPGPGGEAFYDNVMLWAAKNGMVGVSIQRDGVGPASVADALAWVHKTIGGYGGDPQRVFIWGHSAGAVTVSNYLGHPQAYGPGGVGVKGAILMSGVYDLYPLKLTSPPMVFRMGKGGPAGPPPAPPPPPPGAPDAGQRSILSGMKTLPIPVFLSAAEIDPPLMLESLKQLDAQMIEAGKTPKMVIYKDHGHMSEIMAVNTTDQSTSKPVLDWMRSVK